MKITVFFFQDVVSSFQLFLNDDAVFAKFAHLAVDLTFMNNIVCLHFMRTIRTKEIVGLFISCAGAT